MINYIIIGVTEVNGVATEFHDIPALIDEAKVSTV